MAGFDDALLDPFDWFALPMCNGVLKGTFFFAEMVSIAAGVVASFGTLNLMKPNLSAAGYDNSIGGLVVSSNT